MRRPMLVMNAIGAASLWLASMAAAQTEMALGTVSLAPGGTGSVTLTITADSGVDLAGINAKVDIPEGVSLVNISEGALISQGDFVTDWRILSSTTASMITYSGTSAFDSSSGTILTLELEASANAAPGQFPLKFTRYKW